MASQELNQSSTDFVTMICSEFEEVNSDDTDEIILSTSSINSWDVTSIQSRKHLYIEANANRLIEESSYFHGLLGGSFSESRLNCITIQWDVESFVSVVSFVFGCQLEVSWDNFIPLYGAALFFGVDKLLLKLHIWLEEATACQDLDSTTFSLNDLIHILKYGLEQANGFILKLCTSFMARNFMWAISFNSFNDVPEQLLCSCINHPDLTVDSEKHLCNAILGWLSTNTEKTESWIGKINSTKVRTRLLPLWFTAGKQRCHFFSNIAKETTTTILNLVNHSTMSSMDIFEDYNPTHLKIRLTKYTQKVDISGCPQMTLGWLLLSTLPYSSDIPTLRKIINISPMNRANVGVEADSHISKILRLILTFEAVHEVDISNCPFLSVDLFADYLCTSFPSLRTLRASHFLNFKTVKLCQLAQKFPQLTNIDLTLDTSPLIPGQISVVSSSSVSMAQRSAPTLDMYYHSSAASLSHVQRGSLSNIKKLILEGRSDLSDIDLQYISEVCISLNYINMKGCLSVTDSGISAMIFKCKKLQSLLACDTSLGNNSILALCSGGSCENKQREHHSQLTADKFLDFHIGGCFGISEDVLCRLLSVSDCLRSLCLSRIGNIDNALYKFSGTSLEMIDISDTKVSCAALSHIIHRNHGLKCIKTRGCTNLVQVQIGSKRELCDTPIVPEELYTMLGKSCKLENIELGWGFSFLSIEALKPAIRTLRTITIGLGGSLGHDGLNLLPTLCPLLETLVLSFQVISDSTVANITRAFPNLQFLALCYCLGDISLVAFNHKMPNLRHLKLERVMPRMTNEDLSVLAENCGHLMKLSLIGCPLLNIESKDIISSAWPGLTHLCIEECGQITADGVGSLLNCHALEDLTLRHTGSGIPRNFIIYAASKLPMLRKISLDICDAMENGFEIPMINDRYFLSTVKIARCKFQRCGLDLQNWKTRWNPVHKEALVIVWNSEKLTRTVVKERL